PAAAPSGGSTSVSSLTSGQTVSNPDAAPAIGRPIPTALGAQSSPRELVHITPAAANSARPTTTESGSSFPWLLLLAGVPALAIAAFAVRETVRARRKATPITADDTTTHRQHH
ncbi:MAG: hypothetical protein ABI559_07300, partial [Chloroflexota bacterium]